MPTFTFECHSDAEWAMVRQAASFVAEMHQLAQGAAQGGVLSAVEDLALDKGRQFLRDTLQSAAQHRIDADEEKGGGAPVRRVRRRRPVQGPAWP